VPRRTDIKKILLIGSGPIVIGQACEFDYSGTQACKALREEDYSIRANIVKKDDALAEALVEVNALSSLLREQRLGALEAAALLQAVMREIEVAVFAFDDRQRLRLVNRAGERLLASHEERLLGRTAEQLGLATCLQGERIQVLDAVFPGSGGRWEMHRTGFRQGGLPHQLLVLTDLSRALREEERQVWQRLIRVLGHELNNSLAPIKSIAGSLRDLSRRSSRPEDWRDDLQRGLEIIESRSEALSNFIGAYAKLARLPQPVLQNVDLETWIKRVVGLETRVHVELIEGEGITLLADPDQLEQLLINLLRNAVDAALETGGGVKLAWTIQGDQLQIRIEDDGPGLPDSSNLFVPFFTTKPGGSGIGLVLCRQIAEAHGGSLTIQNKSTGHGCLVNLTLPLHNAPSRTHINSKVLVK